MDLWCQFEKAKNLGHVGPRYTKVPRQFSPRANSARIKDTLPLLCQDYRVAVLLAQLGRRCFCEQIRQGSTEVASKESIGLTAILGAQGQPGCETDSQESSDSPPTRGAIYKVVVVGTPTNAKGVVKPVSLTTPFAFLGICA